MRLRGRRLVARRACFRMMPAPQAHLLLRLLLLELLDLALPLHPHLEVGIGSERLRREADHAESIVHKPIRDGSRREELGLLLVLVGVGDGPHADPEVLARGDGRDLRLAGRNPLSVDVDDTGLALTLLALVPDEHVCLGSHLAQRLAHSRHGHDILRLKHNRSIPKKLVAGDHLGGLLLLGRESEIVHFWRLQVIDTWKLQRREEWCRFFALLLEGRNLLLLFIALDLLRGLA
mmetsp:Transcript_109523/g.305259  ORF Transcript_109523/g.305259 Transcript_109523/m.305259 type:complete len:234 (-) Transcript_109523:1435-2136(-)